MTWISDFGVEDNDWSALIPDLKPIERLWDELELIESDCESGLPVKRPCLTSQMLSWKNGQIFP